MDITTILIALVVIGVVLFFAWPQFRQMLRIRGGKAVNAATTALEKEQDEYEQLMKQLPTLRQRVARAKAGAVTANKDLEAARKRVTEIEGEYKLAVQQNASADTLTAIETDYAAAEQAVVDQTTIVTEADRIAEEAVKAVEDTEKGLKKFASRLEHDARKVELTEALKVAGETRQAVKDIQGQLSKAGQASREIDKALEEARALNDMSKGSTSDQERERLKEQAAASTARDKLRGKLGLGGDTTPPAAQ